MPIRKFARLAITRVRRGRGRSKKNWQEVIRLDMTHLQLSKNMTIDKNVWTL